MRSPLPERPYFPRKLTLPDSDEATDVGLASE